MDSLGRFFAKRYGYAVAVMLPVVGGCVVIGLVLNVLGARGASRGLQDGIAIFGMLLLMTLFGVVILAHRPLPGPFGAWQRLWKRIPTWNGRIAEMAREKRGK